MKIAIPVVDDNGFDSKVNKHFGRTPYFAVVDTEQNEINIIKNEAAKASGGAGVSAAQLMADRGVEILISGSVGPKAYAALNSGNIKIYSVNNENTVKQVVDSFKNGKISQLTSPNGTPHK